MRILNQPITKIIFLIVGIIALIILCTRFGMDLFKQSKCTAETDAVITAIDTKKVKRPGKNRAMSSYYATEYYPVYSFTADGTEYSGSDEWASRSEKDYYHKGGIVKVHYQPDDPSNNFVAYVIIFRYYNLLAAVVICLPLGVIGVTSWLKNKKIRR